jgi:hypothetical protein
MRVYNEVGPVRQVLFVTFWLSGSVRMYKDGDGFGGVFRAWHPVTWLLLVLMLVPCALMGEKLTGVVPMKLSKFWLDNANQMQWVTPFTKLSALRP